MLLAALSAIGIGRLASSAGRGAEGGPLGLHRQQLAPGAQIPDGALAQPAALPVPAGPHLAVPILYYHYIRDIQPTAENRLSFRLSISPALFEQQMALLHVEGAHPITLAMLMDALAGRQVLPSHPVVLTFDDGYADFATAVEPVMQRYGFVATDFVVSGFIDKPRYMTTGQVLDMDADGMVIGSHTVHHVDLVALPPAAALAEIEAGRAALQKLLGHPVWDFAYPYGGFNANVVQMVRSVGFRDAVTTLGGDEQALNGRFELHRTEIGGAPTLAAFARECGLPLPRTPQLAVIAFLAHQPSPARAA